MDEVERNNQALRVFEQSPCSSGEFTKRFSWTLEAPYKSSATTWHRTKCFSFWQQSLGKPLRLFLLVDYSATRGALCRQGNIHLAWTCTSWIKYFILFYMEAPSYSTHSKITHVNFMKNMCLFIRCGKPWDCFFTWFKPRCYFVLRLCRAFKRTEAGAHCQS